MPQQSDQKLEALLTRIVDAAKAKGYFSSDIAHPKQEIRLFIGGKEIDKQQLTDKQVNKICCAIEQPESLENKRDNPHRGTVEIRLNSKEKVFRNEWGKLKCDLLQLQNQKSQAEVTTNLEQASTPVTEEKQVAQVETPLGGKETQIQEVALLKQTIEQQAQRIEALERKVTLMSKEASSIQNKPLSQWLGSSVSRAANSLGKGVSSWAAQKLEVAQQVFQETQPTRSIRYFDVLDLEQLESGDIPTEQITSPQVNGRQAPQLQEQLKAVQDRIQGVKAKFDQKVADVQKVLEPVAHTALDRAIDQLNNTLNRTQNALERADPVIERVIDKAFERGEPVIRAALANNVGQRLANFLTKESPANQTKVINSPEDMSNKPQGQNQLEEMRERLRQQRQELEKLHTQSHRQVHLDTDGDGITNLEEQMYGTNPYSIDSDFDGRTDLEELNSGTNSRISNTRERFNSASRRVEEELEV